MSERAPSSESFIGKHKKKLIALATGLGLVVAGDKVIEKTEHDAAEDAIVDTDAGQNAAELLETMKKEKESGVSKKREIVKENLPEQKKELQQAIFTQVPAARLRPAGFTQAENSFWISFGTRDDAQAGAEVEVTIEDDGFTLYHPELHRVSVESKEDVVRVVKILSNPQYIAWQKAFKAANMEAMNAKSLARMYDSPTFTEEDKKGRWEEFRVANQKVRDLQGKIEAYLEANGINLPDGYGKIFSE